MYLPFPENFFWGTSTSAAQVETAGDHPWRGLIARDGNSFERTTDHELRRAEDAELIARLGTVYRCSVDWSKLQGQPMAKFESVVVDEYCNFFEVLKGKGVSLMFVLHHFCHPNWFEQLGGWTDENNINYFVNFAQQCIKYFGKYVGWWNTFNEPNVYAYNAYFTGVFPPFKKWNLLKANKVLGNMGRAHNIVRVLIREKHKRSPVGVSLNTAYFESGNFFGKLPTAFSNWWFHKLAAKPFQKCDFWGVNYHTAVLFDPKPIDMINRPEKVQELGLPHDDIWLYKPEGLAHMLRYFWKKYRKPIIITENGICTEDSNQRISALKDYLAICHKAIQDGIDIKGYIHWSTWDNFEWHLGPSYRFGLVQVDFKKMDRTMTNAGLFYEKITQQNGLEV